jgi:hypothetical protein
MAENKKLGKSDEQPQDVQVEEILDEETTDNIAGGTFVSFGETRGLI